MNECLVHQSHNVLLHIVVRDPLVHVVDAAPDIVLDVADLQGHALLTWLPQVLVERLADDLLVLVHHPQKTLELLDSPFHRPGPS